MPASEFLSVNVAAAAGKAVIAAVGDRGPEDLVPPFTAPWQWWLLLPAILLAAAIWLWAARWLARIRLWSLIRRHRTPKQSLPPRRKHSLAQLQRHYLAEVDRIVAEHRRAKIDVREAHIQFSAALRDFVFQHTGVEVRTMTLSELRAAQQSRLAEAVAQYYPIAFAPEERAGLCSAAERAREVISSWS